MSGTLVCCARCIARMIEDILCFECSLAMLESDGGGSIEGTRV
jgi:hypothetical protein